MNEYLKYSSGALFLSGSEMKQVMQTWEKCSGPDSGILHSLTKVSPEQKPAPRTSKGKSSLRIWGEGCTPIKSQHSCLIGLEGKLLTSQLECNARRTDSILPWAIARL